MSNADFRTDIARLLFTLLLLSSLTFAALLVAYALISPNSLGSRLGFAGLMSIAPALTTLLLFYMTRLHVTRWRVVVVYFGLLVLAQLIMEVVR